MLHEDDNICASERKTKTTHGCRQNEHSHGAIVVELIHSLKSIFRTMLAEKSQVFDAEAIKHLLAYEFET